jgi:hypothetical protein
MAHTRAKLLFFRDFFASQTAPIAVEIASLSRREPSRHRCACSKGIAARLDERSARGIFLFAIPHDGG